MKKTFLLLTLTVILLVSCSKSRQKPADYVNPFIGTGFHGHTYPGATVPFGAVQLSPDTRRGNWDACSGYHYSDSSMYGFSHTHLSGTGCIDLGDILFHPTIEEVTLKPEGYIYNMLPFSHENEKASPGFYEVNFPETGIKVALTATPRVGIHQYTFPESTKSKIIIDLAHSLDNERIDHLELKVVSNNEIAGTRLTTGWTPNQHIYFVARFSKPFGNVRLVSSGIAMKDSISISGKNIQAIVGFETTKGEKIDVNVGTSLVSIDNARLNLEAEAPESGFDNYRLKAEALWDEALSDIQVEGQSETEKEIFYTALYHTMVVPNVGSDVNGDYRTHDMQVKRMPEGQKMYSTLSLWDTYRTWHPLMTLINSNITTDIIHSMLSMYETTGELPIWPLASGETGTMIGYHSVSAIWDAWQKGIRDFDGDEALEAMIESSQKPRKGGSHYLAHGWIPADREKESVSCLLEYAYDDWCIAMMAKALGKEDIHREYTLRAYNYVNAFDGNTGFFRGKRSDGNWVTPFSPVVVNRDFTEATAWQYRFYVPHDIHGFSQLLGGYEQFNVALGQLFSEDTKFIAEIPDITGLIGQYAHGNEPSHHVAYLYNYSGEPWKTQERVRYILKEMYQSSPEGIPGNEDCGQMSAWYVMSSLGIYPVCPGSGEYALSTPLFAKAIVKLHNGKVLEIKANDPERNSYISKVTFNGTEITANFITHEMLMKGGLLEFSLTDKPVKTRGIAKADCPYSLTASNRVSSVYCPRDLHLFIGETSLELGCITPGAEIRFTLDGTDPIQGSTLYENPVMLTQSAQVRARAFREGFAPGPEFNVMATKAVMRLPEKKPASENGVRFRYFEGKFKRTDDMLAASALKSGNLPEPSIAGADADDFFGFEFTGFLFAPADGIYDFYTESDDGSVLMIGSEVVVDNDGSHGAIRATGKIALSKGYHSFKLLYFEDYEGNSLEWGWKSPGKESFEKISASNLFMK